MAGALVGPGGAASGWQDWQRQMLDCLPGNVEAMFLGPLLGYSRTGM